MSAYDFASVRLFVPEDLEASAAIAISGGRANYLLNVLRLRDGATILTFNGRDGEWRATLTGTTKRATTLHIDALVRAQTDGPDLDYLFAPLKHARLDYVVQKAVEMGVRRLRPVLTRRTQVARVNTERMRANVVEAAEQCGILALPSVDDERKLDGVLADWEDGRALIVCDESAPVGDPLLALRSLSHAQKFAVLIGPEGGFDDDERAALLAHSATVRVSLGPRILRADTAAVAALTLVQAIGGDWGRAARSDTISPS